MNSFKTPAGVLSAVDAVALIAGFVYFHKQNKTLKCDLKKQTKEMLRMNKKMERMENAIVQMQEEIEEMKKTDGVKTSTSQEKRTTPKIEDIQERQERKVSKAKDKEVSKQDIKDDL